MKRWVLLLLLLLFVLIPIVLEMEQDLLLSEMSVNAGPFTASGERSPE
ncbi:hypothetical protein [Paenibacillus nanensis]|nr:hypothetical protein [Paenibacillus nanensis]